MVILTKYIFIRSFFNDIPVYGGSYSKTAVSKTAVLKNRSNFKLSYSKRERNKQTDKDNGVKKWTIEEI